MATACLSGLNLIEILSCFDNTRSSCTFLTEQFIPLSGGASGTGREVLECSGCIFTAVRLSEYAIFLLNDYAANAAAPNWFAVVGLCQRYETKKFI